MPKGPFLFYHGVLIMEIWQLVLGAVLALIYLGMNVMIFVFNWGRVYDNPQPPQWQCGFHKLTLVSCILNIVVGGGFAIGFFYGVMALLMKP